MLAQPFTIPRSHLMTAHMMMMPHAGKTCKEIDTALYSMFMDLLKREQVARRKATGVKA